MSTRITCQRTAILAVLRDAPGPLRPQEMLERASRRVPTLGVATVYRQLKRLQASGEVRAVELGRNDVRYEPADRGPHRHFLCRACGDVSDVEGCPSGIAEMAPPGFEVDENEVTLYGRCCDCTTADGKAG
jgi:Fur family ferric uptake transcriptional regulator